jgi:hypothetical protein
MLAIAWTLVGLTAATLGVLATAVLGLGGRIDAMGDRLGARIDAMGDSLGSRIEAMGARLDGRLDAQASRIDAQTARIDALAGEMHAEFRDLDLRLTRAGG